MNNFIVFYGNQIYGEYQTHKQVSIDLFPHTEVQSNVYNEGYIYVTNQKPHWYRCDFTPVLDEDVPKALKLMMLLIK